MGALTTLTNLIRIVGGFSGQANVPVRELTLSPMSADAGYNATVVGGKGSKTLRRTNGATGVTSDVTTFTAGGTQVIGDTLP